MNRFPGGLYTIPWYRQQKGILNHITSSPGTTLIDICCVYTDGISETFNVIDLAEPSFGGKNRSSKITTMGAHF